MLPPGYISKTKAVTELQAKTGRGRRVVENVMAALEETGRIHILPDPIDKRILRLSLEDMELVRRVLMEEEKF